jgi:hypothetical protein
MVCPVSAGGAQEYDEDAYWRTIDELGRLKRPVAPSDLLPQGGEAMLGTKGAPGKSRERPAVPEDGPLPRPTR